MTLWIAPRFRSRRAVADGGPLLSVAYDLTCFMKFVQRYKLWLKSASMRLWIAPCLRSRRAVSNGGLLLSVAYDSTCLVTFFGFHGCIHACMHACMHACTHASMHAYMHTSMHASMHGWRVRGFGSAGFLKVEEKIQKMIKNRLWA